MRWAKNAPSIRQRSVEPLLRIRCTPRGTKISPASYLLFSTPVFVLASPHKHKPKFAHTALISTFVSCFKPHSKTTFRAFFLAPSRVTRPRYSSFADRAHVVATTTTTELKPIPLSRSVRKPKDTRTKSRSLLFFIPPSQTLSRSRSRLCRM